MTVIAGSGSSAARRCSRRAVAGTPLDRADRTGARTRASRSCGRMTADTVDFEAGYIRHLELHRQARDTWAWYGWTVTFGERQRWFVYASFGHSAASLDNPVPPAEDERDNVVNVTPHAEFAGNALYEFLPALSRGTGVPQPAARLELTTVDLDAGRRGGVRGGARPRRNRRCRARHSGIGWWPADRRRATSGCVRGPACRRFSTARPSRRCPRRRCRLVARTTVEILTLRPTMSYGLPPARTDRDEA